MTESAFTFYDVFVFDLVDQSNILEYHKLHHIKLIFA